MRSAGNGCNVTCCYEKRDSHTSKPKTYRPSSRSISTRCLNTQQPISRGGENMLKALVNEARLRLDITTQGPLLIKTGYATVIGADMAPVLTYRHNGQQEIYLPGSSLKGLFRSHSEKVINSIQPRVACNPLLRPNDPGDRRLYRDFCGSHFNDKDLPHLIYTGSCPTCRLFGSTQFAGRLAVQD